MNKSIYTSYDKFNLWPMGIHISSFIQFERLTHLKLSQKNVRQMDGHDPFILEYQTWYSIYRKGHFGNIKRYTKLKKANSQTFCLFCLHFSLGMEIFSQLFIQDLFSFHFVINFYSLFGYLENFHERKKNIALF